MNYFKKIIDWVLTAYEPEFKPKRVYKYKGKTYYLKKRKRKMIGEYTVKIGNKLLIHKCR